MGVSRAVTAPSGRGARPLARLLAADPRLKMLATMLFGALALSAGPLGLALFCLPLAGLLGTLATSRPVNRSIIKSYLLFLAIWVGLKLGLDLFTGLSPAAALAVAGLLGLRLAVLLMLGLALSLATSPRSLGLGLASLLRPVLLGNAWRAALATALFVHFLPLVWYSIQAVKTSFAVRGARLSFWRKMLFFCQSLLRYWSMKTWKQTLALATRGLDDPAAWSRPLGFNAREWALGCLFSGVFAGLLLL